LGGPQGHDTSVEKTLPGTGRGTADPSASLGMTKGEGDASKESGCRTEGVFHHLRWDQAQTTT
jgi:hypothetical protein